MHAEQVDYVPRYNPKFVKAVHAKRKEEARAARKAAAAKYFATILPFPAPAPVAPDPEPLVPIEVTKISEIIDHVCEFTGVSRTEILSRAREKRVTKARQYIAWSARKVLGLPLPQIGRYLNRDHTTIIHALQTVSSFPEKWEMYPIFVAPEEKIDESANQDKADGCTAQANCCSECGARGGRHGRAKWGYTAPDGRSLDEILSGF